MDFGLLGEYGIDSRRGIDRCLGDEQLYATLLSMFLEDRSLDLAAAALESRDYPALFLCMHELKGACGSAEMTALYQAVCPLVALLRLGGGTDMEIALLYERVESAYNRAREGIIRAADG